MFDKINNNEIDIKMKIKEIKVIKSLKETKKAKTTLIMRQSSLVHKKVFNKKRSGIRMEQIFVHLVSKGIQRIQSPDPKWQPVPH